MSKVKALLLIVTIFQIISINIEMINYKNGLELSYLINEKKTFELAFDSYNSIPENIHLKLNSLNIINQVISFSSHDPTCTNDPILKSTELDLYLEKSQLSTSKNYLCIACENQLNCEFSISFSEEKKGLKLEENDNLTLKSSLEEWGDDDNIVLKARKDVTIDLYILPSGYEKVIQLPKNKLKIYQISEGKSGKYKIISGNSVEVNNEGTVYPKNTTIYWYGNIGGSIPSKGRTPTSITTDFNYGTSVIRVNFGTEVYKITVNVKNYAKEYAENKLDDYIKKYVNVKTNQLDKLKEITAYPAKFPYNYRYSGYVSMVIFEGGDCIASASTIQYMCEKVGIKSHIRYAANDVGAGTGHRNVAALINKKIYICEAGYGIEKANRPYHVKELNVGYSYKNIGNKKIVIYQYDGYDEIINVPSTINNMTVVGLEKVVFYSGASRSGIVIKKITLPSTITSIGSAVFKYLRNITTMTIPKNVEKIEPYPFLGCSSLTTIIVNSLNKYYCAVNGILYNKDKTEIIAYPAGKKEKTYNGISTLKRVYNHTFYEVKNIEKIVLPKSINYIGEGAFGESGIKEIYFSGNQPNFVHHCFHKINVTVYYPRNAKWKVDKLDTYSAKAVKWVPWTPTTITKLNLNTTSNFDNNKYLYVFGIIAILILLLSIVALIKRSNSKNKEYLEISTDGLMA